MQFCTRQFNLYFAAFLTMALLCGCQSDSDDKTKSAIGVLRVHLEVPDEDTFGTTQTISVMRDDPVKVTIAKDPILSEANLLGARLLETPDGGYAVELKFDETSSMMLEQYSASNVGKHFVIFSQWGKKAADGRWVAAPLVTHHLANGILSFTPDASRDEATLLVAGLNNVAKRNHSSGWRSMLQ